MPNQAETKFPVGTLLSTVDIDCQLPIYVIKNRREDRLFLEIGHAILVVGHKTICEIYKCTKDECFSMFEPCLGKLKTSEVYTPNVWCEVLISSIGVGYVRPEDIFISDAEISLPKDTKSNVGV